MTLLHLPPLQVHDTRYVRAFCITSTRVDSYPLTLFPIYQHSPRAIINRVNSFIQTDSRLAQQLDMDLIASAFRPDISISDFFSRPVMAESGDKSPSPADQHMELPGDVDMVNSDVSLESTPASSCGGETETARKDDNCDDMMEKWRLIRLADRQKAKKKVATAENGILTGN